MRIKEFRFKKGLSQNDLGKLTGMSQQQIAQYENEKRRPKMETLAKIAKALDVSVSELISDEYIGEAYKPSYSLREQAEHATIVKTENETFQNLAISFSRLTNEGQQKVADYADDLAKIPQYQRHED